MLGPEAVMRTKESLDVRRNRQIRLVGRPLIFRLFDQSRICQDGRRCQQNEKEVEMTHFCQWLLVFRIKLKYTGPNRPMVQGVGQRRTNRGQPDLSDLGLTLTL